MMSQEDIINEMEELMYKNPKCDFEHAWNCGIGTAKEIIETGAETQTTD